MTDVIANLILFGLLGAAMLVLVVSVVRGAKGKRDDEEE